MSKFVLSAFSDEISEDLTIQMNVLEKYNINHIEIRGVYGKNISTFTPEEIKEIKKQLDAKNFKISAIGSPIGKIKITDDFAPEIERFKNALEIAKILGTEYIRIFSFYLPKDDDPKVYRDEVLNRLSKYLEIAKDSGVTLLHENEKDIYGDIPERCLDILKSINSPNLWATFDPANFVQCGVKVFPHAFEMLKPYIKYIHIKDAKAATGEVVPSGYGDGKVKEVLNELKSKGYNGFLSIEPHLADFKGFSDLESDNQFLSKLDSIQTFDLAVSSLYRILSELGA